MAGPDGEQGLDAPRFEPLSPAPRNRLIVGFVLGPILWLAALVIAAWALDETSAIALGLAVVVARLHHRGGRALLGVRRATSTGEAV